MAEKEAKKLETYAEVVNKKTLTVDQPDDGQQARSRSVQNVLQTVQGHPPGTSQPIRGNSGSRLPRFFGGIRRDNPQFHSFPKSRWKDPPDPDKFTSGSATGSGKPDQSGRTRSDQSVKSDQASESGGRSRSLQQLAEKFKLPELSQIPGLNFAAETPKPPSRRNSKKRRSSGPKSSEEKVPASTTSSTTPTTTRRRRSRKRKASGRSKSAETVAPECQPVQETHFWDESEVAEGDSNTAGSHQVPSGSVHQQVTTDIGTRPKLKPASSRTIPIKVTKEVSSQEPQKATKKINTHYVEIPFKDESKDVSIISKSTHGSGGSSGNNGSSSVVYGLKTSSTYYEHVTYGIGSKQESKSSQASASSNRSTTTTATTRSVQRCTALSDDQLSSKVSRQVDDSGFYKSSKSSRVPLQSGDPTWRSLPITMTPASSRPAFEVKGQPVWQDPVDLKLPIFVEEEILEDSCVVDVGVDALFPGTARAEAEKSGDKFHRIVRTEHPLVLLQHPLQTENPEMRHVEIVQDSSQEPPIKDVRYKSPDKILAHIKPETDETAGNLSSDEEDNGSTQSQTNIFLTECPESQEAQTSEATSSLVIPVYYERTEEGLGKEDKAEGLLVGGLKACLSKSVPNKTLDITGTISASEEQSSGSVSLSGGSEIAETGSETGLGCPAAEKIEVRCESPVLLLLLRMSLH